MIFRFLRRSFTCLSLLSGLISVAVVSLPLAAQAQQQPAGLRLARDFMLRTARVVGRVAPPPARGTGPAASRPAAPGQGNAGAGMTGYGFVVGTHPTANGHPGLLIVTADHLVRDPANPDQRFQPPVITLYDDLEHPAAAELLDQHLPPDQGDLALLVVGATASFHGVAAVESQSLLSGIPAWQAGRAGVMQPPETPGRFTRFRAPGWLSFEGLDTAPGAAGAAVLVNRGLAGMTVRANPEKPNEIDVLPIDVIAARLQAWGMDWQIAPPGTEVSTETAPSAARPARSVLSSLSAPSLQVQPLLPSEVSARASWVPTDARLSPWALKSTPLLVTPTSDAPRLGTMPPGNQLPAELWASGAYQILSKLDRGAWFLAGSSGRPIGYVSGSDVIEVWPAMPGQTPISGKLVREWTVEGGQKAELRDAGSHYELSIPMTCKLEFCNQVSAFSPLPPAAGAVVPMLVVPPVTGQWQQETVVAIHLQLPRALVETKGALLMGCIGRRDSCEEQTLLTGG